MPRIKSKPALLGGNLLSKTLRHKADCDYVDRLSPEEREWMDRFVDQIYGGDFRKDVDGKWTPEQRRKVWAELRAAREDAYGMAGLANGPEELPLHQEAEPVGKDWGQSPDYLDTEEYRAARDEYRATLTQQRRPAEPEQTPRFLAARRRLGVVTPSALGTVRPRPLKTPTPRKRK